MKKKSILRSLLACSILPCSYAYAVETIIGNGETYTISDGSPDIVVGIVSKDFNFVHQDPPNPDVPSDGILHFNTSVTYTGEFKNGSLGKVEITGNNTVFTYAGGVDVNVGEIIFGTANLAGIKAFNVNNPNGVTTINSPLSTFTDGCRSFTFYTPVVFTQNWAAYYLTRNDEVYIGSEDTPSSMTFRPENHLVREAHSYASHEDSAYIIDSSSDTDGSITFKTGHYGGQLKKVSAFDTPENIAHPTNDVGIIQAIANGSKIILTNDNPYKWGVDVTSRLKKLKLYGHSDIDINTEAYIKILEFNNSANVTFFRDHNLGTNGQIDLLENANLVMNGGKSIEINDAALNLNTSNLNLLEGNIVLKGNASVNLEFADDGSKNGKIVIGGGDQNAKLDLSGLSKLDINFTATTANTNTDHENELEFSFPIFVADANGSIVDIPDNNNIAFVPDETNLFMSWDYNPDTYTISSTTDWDGLLNAIAPAPDPAPAPVSQNVKNFVTAITETAKEGVNLKKVKADELVTPTAEQKTAAKFIQFAGTLGSVEEVVEAVKNMDPETSSEALDDNSIGFETGRIVLDRNIDSISSSSTPEVSFAADSNPLGYGIAAGDDLSKKYGIWATPFYHKAIQRKLDGNAGYKVENFGTVIGVDTKISDLTTIGFAWGNVRSLVRMSGAKEGSKGDTVGNIFSLYSSLELPKSTFVTGILSYGMSKIKRLEKKHLARNIYNYARSHYKSKMYSAEVIAGKNMYFGSQYTLTPMAGVKYSEYRDDAYKEHGTLFQNFNMTKKKYSHLDGSLGARLSYTTSYNNYKVIPNLTGMAYFNLKDNPSTSYVTSDTFTKPLQLKGDKKSSKAWYSITAGLDFNKDNMEYSVEYEHQIDKKYVGHQAKIKAKLNF